jgi:hypothetical protein
MEVGRPTGKTRFGKKKLAICLAGFCASRCFESAVGYAKDCADSMSTLTTQGARREIPRGLNKLSVFLGVFVYHVGAKHAAPRAPHSPAVPRAVPVGHDRQKHAAAQPVGAGRHRQLRGAPRAIFFKSQSLKTCSLSKSDVG